MKHSAPAMSTRAWIELAMLALLWGGSFFSIVILLGWVFLDDRLAP